MLPELSPKSAVGLKVTAIHEGADRIIFVFGEYGYLAVKVEQDYDSAPAPVFTRLHLLDVSEAVACGIGLASFTETHAAHAAWDAQEADNAARRDREIYERLRQKFEGKP